MTMKCFICDTKGCLFCGNRGYIKDNDPRMPSIIAYLDVQELIRKQSQEKAEALAAAAAKAKESALAKLAPEELAALGLVKT